MTTNTGGPAFPNVEEVVLYGDNTALEKVLTGGGMTLRDYFAAKAMQGMWSVVGVNFGTLEAQAANAYRMADAMLKGREK